MFKKQLAQMSHVKETENGAIVYDSSMDKVVDLFAQIGAIRSRSTKDKWHTFYNAYLQDKDLALKTLFYARDCREGQGERDTFRDIYKFLVTYDLQTALYNVGNIEEFGRFDDLIDIALDSSSETFKNYVVKLIKDSIEIDINSETPSLLGKWLPSINTSSIKTRTKAKVLSKLLGYTPKEYRKICSALRNKLNIIETKLTNKNYESINYEQVPSLAMLKYRNCLKTKDTNRYNEYIRSVVSGEKKINASTLYPYDIVRKYYCGSVDNQLEEQWKALPNYVTKEDWNGIVVADVSGSMNGLPLEVAISLAIYTSEKNKGAFSNCFITFSERPTFVDLESCKTLRDKISKASNANWGFNTNLQKVFDLILNTAIKNNAPQSELPQQLFIITDMEFDRGSEVYGSRKTFMENIKEKYNQAGYELPKLVWWNVNARNSTFPMTVDEAGVQYVSGCSPVILKTLLGGEFLSPIDVVRNTVDIPRYKNVKIFKKSIDMK